MTQDKLSPKYSGRFSQMTEEMIKSYLEHHFEPNQHDNFNVEP